jgi:predicted RNA-binding protein with PIN domain
MHYLIDGHNLIAKLPDIDLSDPDDEIQLILKLRQWTAVSLKRVVTVYFDGGIPGGHNVNLSNSQVKVIFVSQGKTADSLLIARIKRVKNPPEYRLVTSDQEIINAANMRKMQHIRSENFAVRLGRTEKNAPCPALPSAMPIRSLAMPKWRSGLIYLALSMKKHCATAPNQSRPTGLSPNRNQNRKKHRPFPNHLPQPTVKTRN